jgi:hypothetical protein
MYEGCATDYVTYTSAFVAVNYHPWLLFERDEFQKRETSQHLDNIHLVAHQSDQTVKREG